MSLPAAGVCLHKVGGCYCDNLYVKKTLYVDYISPRVKNSIIIDGLDLACISLTNQRTLVGCGAGSSLTTGTNNTLVGINSGTEVTTGSDNVCVGGGSGIAETTGSNNVYVGSAAGAAIVTGSSNVIVGSASGAATSTSLTGCVLVGSAAGLSNTTNNRLMIDNSVTDEPLIDGDFTNNTVQLNAETTLGQTANTTNIHQINGLINGSAPTPGATTEALRININGTQYWIYLYSTV